MYDPTLGRWIQQDPMGYVDGMNRYEAVRSNPSVYVDPLGLAADPIVVTDFQPSRARGVPWTNAPVPGGGGVTQAVGSVSAAVDECNDCQVIFTVTLRMTVTLDLRSINALDSRLTRDGAYGHEQVHVLDILDIGNSIVARMNRSNEINKPPDDCEETRAWAAEQAAHWVKELDDALKEYNRTQHSGPNRPGPSQNIDPIGPVPPETPPTTRPTTGPATTRG